MNILIAGFTDSSAIAIERAASSAVSSKLDFRYFQRRTVSIADGKLDAIADQTPEQQACFACIVNLLGMGWGRWSFENQVRLDEFIAGRPSLVILPPGNVGQWAVVHTNMAPEMLRMQLQHPLTSSALQDAFKTLRKASQQKAAAVAVDQNIDGASSKERGLGRFGAPAAPKVVDVAAATQAKLQITGQVLTPTPLQLSKEACDTVFAVFPDIAKNQYIKMIFNCATMTQPSFLKISAQSGVIFCPAENWLVSNVSLAFHKHMVQHSMMVQIARVTEVHPSSVPSYAAQLFDNWQDKKRPIPNNLWRMVYYTFYNHQPVANGNINFKLNHFPNFGRMRLVPDVFLQLALVCLGKHRSMGELKQTFPKQSPRVIELFVACAVLSGHASIEKEARHNALKPAVVLSKETIQKRSFFKTLLDKLF